ncbi:MAG TPA: LCP family protein [Mobilitalea sp.]|nr:LCP family protein [Mobilitalea sp.]
MASDSNNKADNLNTDIEKVNTPNIVEGVEETSNIVEGLEDLPNIIEGVEDLSYITEDVDTEDDSIRASLRQQVEEELNWQKTDSEQAVGSDTPEVGKKAKGSKKKKILMSIGIFFIVLLIFTIWLVGTKSGQSVIYKIAASYIYKNIDKEDYVETDVDIPQVNTDQDKQSPDIKGVVETGDILGTDNPQKPEVEPRSEDYVSNYLIFGIEEIDNAKNTDTMMLISVNTLDKTIKMTSLLRDTYVEPVGHNPNKLNAIYAMEGSSGLVELIEQNYRVKIDGYANVNFNAFEEIIDYLGGISIEMGEEEAHYLNTKNYISIKSNRNIVQGWNLLNGNQALGYCRVRRCVTLGGANDDYGRTLRQRRVLKAIFNRYKSKNVFELLKIMDDCLGYVKTNLTKAQIEKLLKDVVENKITSMDTLRVPVNNTFETPDNYGKVDDPLVIDWDANIIELYQFIFLDTVEEAQTALELQRN